MMPAPAITSAIALSRSTPPFANASRHSFRSGASGVMRVNSFTMLVGVRMKGSSHSRFHVRTKLCSAWPLSPSSLLKVKRSAASFAAAATSSGGFCTSCATRWRNSAVSGFRPSLDAWRTASV
jgi:hypothetical protein